MSGHLSVFCQQHGINEGDLNRRLLELRALGLSHADIGRVVAYYEGWPLSESQVHRRLRSLGVRGRPPRKPRRRRREAVAR